MFSASSYPTSGNQEHTNIQWLSPQQSPLQRSSQDVHRHPHFQQPPPQYSQIQQHRWSQPPPPIEVNEMGPTIQQGVIQCPVWQGPQQRTAGAQLRDTANTIPAQSSMMPQTRAQPLSQGHNNGNVTSDPEGNGRDRYQNVNMNKYL